MKRVTMCLLYLILALSIAAPARATPIRATPIRVPPISSSFAQSAVEAQRLKQALNRGEVIRLHIVANSDSPVDQETKLYVRDQLLAAYRGALALDTDDPMALLERLLPRLIDTARQAASERGFEGSVTGETGVFEFPAKAYGRVLLPAGEYKALRVTLGAGAGRNWFCILFPSLCLATAETQGEPNALVWRVPDIWKQWMLWPAGSEKEGA